MRFLTHPFIQTYEILKSTTCCEQRAIIQTKNAEKTGSDNFLFQTMNYSLDGKEVSLILFDTAVDGKYMIQRFPTSRKIKQSLQRIFHGDFIVQINMIC